MQSKHMQFFSSWIEVYVSPLLQRHDPMCIFTTPHCNWKQGACNKRDEFSIIIWLFIIFIQKIYIFFEIVFGNLIKGLI